MGFQTKIFLWMPGTLVAILVPTLKVGKGDLSAMRVESMAARSEV